MLKGGFPLHILGTARVKTTECKLLTQQVINHDNSSDIIYVKRKPNRVQNIRKSPDISMHQSSRFQAGTPDDGDSRFKSLPPISC